jgi:5-methyltetrahydrofolate--homocysteine methyltransferase
MQNLNDRQKLLINLAKQRVLVLDGAMGTAIQDLNLTAEDFGGSDFEGCNENLVITRPDVVSKIHEQYLEAGADIIETNTFGSTPVVLDEYQLGSKAYEISKVAAEIACQAVKKYSTKEQPRFVAGSMGPTTKAISVTGGITFQQLIENYWVQAKGLIDGGSDYLLIETAQDSRNIKAALIAIEKLEKEKGIQILTAVSGTIETMGTMLAGQTVEAFFASVMHRELFYIGLNCATGPEFMTDHIRTLAKLSPFPIACIPNAGLPDEDGKYLETPESMGKILSQFMENGWINFIGGCCGTQFHHIRKFSEIAPKFKPRIQIPPKKSFLSGIDFLEVGDDMRPIIVGERTNVIGSKKFKTLISSEQFEEAADVARAQVKSGAAVVDFCLSNPDRNELEDMKRFLEKAIKVVKAPVMIDSTDEKVIELALTYTQGKSIINSINLEDGEKRFEEVVPLAKSFGAALVVGTIDEDPQQGMAVTAQRKLAVAERSYELLTKKFAFPEEDIYFDPLVFPCATGDENYIGSAKQTIEGIKLIKQKYPACKTVLGISNVSFGLPGAGREVLNAVFLNHCVEAGLDLAIVNSEKLERFANIPDHELQLSNNLLFNISTEIAPDPIAAFAAHFRERKKVSTIDRSSIPIEERLAKNIIDGSKEGLMDDLQTILKTLKPLQIINGPLMKGMDEVGRLFNSNKLIVAEVLQSAEVMKAAVAFLEPFMEKSESTNRGKILLATVKGDVHDIGKNLVDIILSNNGYQVINLGIKIPPEILIENVRKHKPDIIGLSGLLVKSAHQMVVTAEDLTNAGITTPMLVGGAALSKSFTEKRILPAYKGPVLYANDAMNGLELANNIQNKDKFAEILKNTEELRKHVGKLTEAPVEKPAEVFQKSQIQVVNEIPQPPDYNRHIINTIPIERIWKFVNPLMLYSRHLGIKAKSAKMLGDLEEGKIKESQMASEDSKALEIWKQVQEIKKEYKGSAVFAPRAVYQYCKAWSDRNRLTLLSNGQKFTFDFPRQNKAPYLCLSDYVAGEETLSDNVALFVATAGNKVRETAEDLKAKGQFLKCHALQALALETAEATAEWMHGFLRGLWGFPDSTELKMMERFQAKYRGKRYSFGYPACPKLDDQAILWKILNPSEIGVQLTEGFMMDPEASVSALVFHHPEATYFSVGNQLEANL